MTSPAAEPSDPAEDSARAPVTGEPEIDRALETLQGLESSPLEDHHDRLARVHEELHAALNSDRRTGEGR
ncbi:MAG: hypothetical protein J2P23_12260 [Microlunatus sp.]|nr:hypothetical protein [Microlunatus sp.]